MVGALSLVTPSYAPDLALCEVLVESVNEFVSADVSHFLLVDGRDVPLFRHLESARTHVVAKEDVIPRGFMRLGGTNRWMARGSLRPVGGWLMQQIVKLAAADLVEADTIVFADSDVAFVRPVLAETFAVDGRHRLYRKPAGVTAAMTEHVAWYTTACRMLGVEPEPLPVDDFINWFVSWRRETVLAMRRRIEEMAGKPWQQVLVAQHRVSEYLIYGIYVDRFAAQDFASSPDSRCYPYWEYSPLEGADVESFVAGFGENDVAVGIQSISRTDPEVRADIVSRLAGGRLLLPGLRASRPGR